jgi:NTE family protein
MRFFRRQAGLFLVVLLGVAHPLGWAVPIMPAHVSRERLATNALWDQLRNKPVGERPRVILVLGGGGARGLSHIGVLRVLEQEHIPVDQIVGVSVGALIGALYASGLSVDQIESMAQDIGWKNLTDFSRFRLLKLILTDELLSTSKMEAYLDKKLGGLYFNDLKIPFVCIATDIRTGERVVFKEGPVAFAARASATIPGVFKPVPYRHRSLVDGGVVDNLPTNIITVDDNDFVLAVLPKVESEQKEVTTVLKTLVRSVEIQKDTMMQERKKDADFLIEPNVGDVSMVELDRYKECIDAGLLETRARVLALKKTLLQRAYKKNKKLVAGQ